jgi:nucleotide-binding universal stress UspA family protein
VAIAPHGYAEHDSRPLATVGVAFDGSSEAQQALVAARELARRAHATLRILTVVEPLAFPAVVVSTLEPGTSASRLVEEELRAVHETAVAESRDLVEVEGVLAHGDPSGALLEQTQQTDVLIAGSRGYGPLGAVLLGSTTRKLLNGAACPLIVIPRGRGLELGG